MILTQLEYHLDILGDRANNFEQLKKCKLGAKLTINKKDYICKHITSTGSYRFKSVEEPIKVITYDRSDLKNYEKAYNIMKKVDDVLQNELYGR